MNNFGPWLTDILHRKGWSQSELARRAGINQVTVSRIVSEGRGVGPAVARKIARTLGLPEAEVYERAGLLEGVPQGDREMDDYIAKRLPLISHEKRVALLYFLDHLLESEQAEKRIDHDLVVLDDDSET